MRLVLVRPCRQRQHEGGRDHSEHHDHLLFRILDEKAGDDREQLRGVDDEEPQGVLLFEIAGDALVQLLTSAPKGRPKETSVDAHEVDEEEDDGKEDEGGVGRVVGTAFDLDGLSSRSRSPRRRICFFFFGGGCGRGLKYNN